MGIFRDVSPQTEAYDRVALCPLTSSSCAQKVFQAYSSFLVIFLVQGNQGGNSCTMCVSLLICRLLPSFTQENASGGQRLMNILQAHQNGSGKMVNIAKSASVLHVWIQQRKR
jgi:hypothetical protein